MELTPEETYGLCADLKRGSKYKIRKELDITHRFEDGEEVEIVAFTDINAGRPPSCKNIRARLLKFKGHKDPIWHPLWIINCPECPFYDPMLEEPRSHVNRFKRIQSFGKD